MGDDSPPPSGLPSPQPMDLVIDDATQLLAERLAEQLLGHHGCLEHVTHPPSNANTTSLSELIGTDLPDVLSHPKIRPHPADWENRLPVVARRQLFTGIRQRRAGSPPPLTTSDGSSPMESPPPAMEDLPPPRIDLESDTVPARQLPLAITFDVDSAGGFATSLSVARQGLDWLVIRPPVSNLASSLHLPPVPVGFYDPNGERWRSARAPIHHVPHLPLGRLHGFEAVEVYLLFPRLFHPSLQHWVITDEQWTTWTDEVVMPAIYDTLPSELIQHFTAGARDAQTRATAASVELTTQGRDGPRMQLLHHFIQPQYLAQLWDRIGFYIKQRGHTEFEGCRIFITAKNLKTKSQDPDWQQAQEKFFSTWDQVVNRSFLVEDFYDVGKEVTPPDRSFSFRQASEVARQPLTLTWRRCCLESFRCWLHDVARELGEGHETASATEEDGPGNPTPTTRQLRPRRQPPPTVLVKIPAQPDVEMEVDDHGSDPSVASPHSSSSSSSSSSSPTVAAPPCWWEEYYPLSLTQDLGSLTIQPHLGRRSALRRHGLLYIQLYNTSKGIFAAGNTYPFANHALDTLALDPGLVRAWQHIGQALSHSPQAILRAYLHAKVRCHTALTSCRNHSYGTREEYRVSGPLLHSIHQVMSRRAHPRAIMPQHATVPFFIHPTALFLDWIRWNMNRLCLGFELVYTLQSHTVVHWEHTRVMMMFLRALTYTYGGQGHHLRHSNGLWLDCRVDPGAGNGERVVEGMGVGETLDRYGYGWFLDKVDWASMVFRVAHRSHMAFNTPTLLSAYSRRYQPLVRAQRDYIFVHDIFSQMQAWRDGPPARTAVLLDLLVDVCLRAFWKDVFRALQASKPQQPIKKQALADALAGAVPLTIVGFRRVFQRAPVETEFQYVRGSNAKVGHVQVLFSWLWGWAGDGNHGGDWRRKGWEQKLYRLLFRQCFEVITQVFGLGQARAWRATLQYRFVRTHWVLPYPNNQRFWSRGTGLHGTGRRRLLTWVSVHPDVERYHREDPLRERTVPLAAINQLPIRGWQRGAQPMDLSVELPTIPSDLEVLVAAVTRPSPSTRAAGSSPPPPSAQGLPLPVIRVTAGPMQQHLLSYHQDESRVTRLGQQQAQQEQLATEQLLEQLPRVSEAFWKRVQEEYQSIALYRRPHVEPARPAATPLSDDGGSAAADVEEDSDPDNLSSRQRTVNRGRQWLYDIDQWTKKHVQKYHRYAQALQEAEQRTYGIGPGMTAGEFERQRQADVRKARTRQRDILRAMGEVAKCIGTIYSDVEETAADAGASVGGCTT